MRELSSTTLAQVCQVLSKQYGVQVDIQGSSAFTDFCCKPPKITIPAVLLDDSDYLDKVRGYLDHEAGHVRFTDKKVWLRPYNNACSKFYNQVLNIFEDVFVERKMGEVFPGCVKNFSRLVKAVFSNIPVDNNDGGPNVILTYLLCATRLHAMPQHDAIFLPTMAKYNLAPDLKAVCDDFAIRADSIMSTEDSARLAREFCKILKDKVSSQPEDQQSGDQQSEDHQSEDQQSEDQQSEDQQSEDQNRYRDDLNRLLVTQNYNRMVFDIDRMINESICAHVFDNVSRLESPTTMKQCDPCLDFDRVRDINKALQVSSKLSSQLSGLLQTDTITRGLVSTRGRLHPRKLYRLPLCNFNVFKAKVEKPKHNTEVVIAIDSSGSMYSNKKNIIAGQALYSLLHCLKRIPGVKSAAFGFNGDDVFDLVGLNDSVTRNTLLTPRGNGGTRCGSASFYGISKFTHDNDTKKLFFILTDGATHDETVMQLAVKRMKAMGIMPFGIGILDKNLLGYLDPEDCCIVDRLESLPEAMFKMVRERMTKVK